MTLKELKTISDLLIDLAEFHSANSDGDESGLVEEIDREYNKVMNIIRDERYKLYLRNAKAKIKRARK